MNGEDSQSVVNTPNDVRGELTDPFHDFAMLISVTPESFVESWGSALSAALPGNDMNINIMKPTLVVFAVRAPVEFMAIDRAEEWLTGIANQLDSSISLKFNAQPTQEISFGTMPFEENDGTEEEDEPATVGIPMMEIGERKV